MGAYILVAIGMLFVAGVRTAVSDGLDAQKATIVAISFAVGAGLEQQTIFADVLGGTWGPLLDNGVVMGAATAVLLTLFIEATRPIRQTRLEVDLSVSSLPEIDQFLRDIASRLGWNQASTSRLRSGEETLISLIHLRGTAPGEGPPRFIVIARPSDSLVELEFLAVFDEENLEDRLAYLSEEAEGGQGIEPAPSNAGTSTRPVYPRIW